jgi:hypothetical protein
MLCNYSSSGKVERKAWAFSLAASRVEQQMLFALMAFHLLGLMAGAAGRR